MHALLFIGVHRRSHDPFGRSSWSYPMPPQTPRMRRANWMSFCMMVTRLAWIAHRLVSSKRWTRKASEASCRAMMACDCHRMPSSLGRNSRAISRTWALGSAAWSQRERGQDRGGVLPAGQRVAFGSAIQCHFVVSGFLAGQECQVDSVFSFQ